MEAGEGQQRMGLIGIIDNGCESEQTLEDGDEPGELDKSAEVTKVND